MKRSLTLSSINGERIEECSYLQELFNLPPHVILHVASNTLGQLVASWLAIELCLIQSITVFSDLSRVSILRHLEREHSRKHHFVTMDWVIDSIASKCLKNERPYEPIL